MHHLCEKLHLEQLLNQNPMVQELGRNVRNFLINPFKDSKKAQRPGLGSEGGEGDEGDGGELSLRSLRRQKERRVLHVEIE
jgi:hypothetical protein